MPAKKLTRHEDGGVDFDDAAAATHATRSGSPARHSLGNTTRLGDYAVAGGLRVRFWSTRTFVLKPSLLDYDS
jgi:hypothetical protein